MSEYQYYEFVAIDRPLTREEMAELRSRSTRATITPTSFVNEYHWGDLKGDPADWMRRYFDAFVYVANWCSCRLALRVPHAVFSKAELKRFSTKYALTVDDSGSHWIIDWSLDESEDYDRFGMEDGTGWMGRLAPLRDELLRGDVRPLYLGWLAGVSAREIGDDAAEPEVPPGMSQLSAAQQALAEFLEIDPDLLAAAPSGTQRRVAELRALAEEEKKLRLQREAKERARQEAGHRKKREAYLVTLAADFDHCWNAIHQHAERGTASAYDKVKRGIADLADAYALASKRDAFDHALRQFMLRHTKRGALVRRLVEVGLWQK